MLVARSTDHGATWEDPVSLNPDESPNAFNDKNPATLSTARAGDRRRA
jgi:hypothetical protein